MYVCICIMIHFIDPPTDLGLIHPSVAVLKYSLALVCPLLGNPEPECEWDVFDKYTRQPIPPTTENYYYIQNCTLIISFFKVAFMNYNFTCNATNYLGTSIANVFVRTNDSKSHYSMST